MLATVVVDQQKGGHLNVLQLLDSHNQRLATLQRTRPLPGTSSYIPRGAQAVFETNAVGVEPAWCGGKRGLMCMFVLLRLCADNIITDLLVFGFEVADVVPKQAWFLFCVPAPTLTLWSCPCLTPPSCPPMCLVVALPLHAPSPPNPLFLPYLSCFLKAMNVFLVPRASFGLLCIVGPSNIRLGATALPRACRGLPSCAIGVPAHHVTRSFALDNVMTLTRRCAGAFNWTADPIEYHAH